VTNNLDTLLTALYVHLDDRVLPALGWSREHRPGRKPALSDAELACLAVAQQLLGIASERRWIRYARAHMAQMFPHLPGQSGYGKRLRSAGGLLAAVITELARDTASFGDLLRLVDSTPLPCAASRGNRQALRSGRARRLWILRQPFTVLLGIPPLPGHHR
jgi:hypothetical protein